MKGALAAILRSLVLPAGVTSGRRIVLDGVNGNIQIYDAANHLVVLIDPVGFIELFSTTTGNLIATMDDQGFTSYAAATTGLRTARLQQSGLFIYDVNGDISGVWDDTGIGLQVTPADNFFRHKLKLDGVTEWGSGAAARDTNLYRAAANLLQTDDAFNAVTDLQVAGASIGRGVLPSGYLIKTAADAARAAGVNTDLTVTVTADATRLYEVTFASQFNVGTAAVIYALDLDEGGTIVGRFGRLSASDVPAGNLTKYIAATIPWTPTSGAKTLTVQNAAGSGGTVALFGAGTQPRWLIVKDVGPR